MRAFMWNTMKDWIQYAAIDNSQRMIDDLGAPGYHLNPKDQLVLESKEDMADRGVASPDDADALAYHANTTDRTDVENAVRLRVAEALDQELVLRAQGMSQAEAESFTRPDMWTPPRWPTTTRKRRGGHA